MSTSKLQSLVSFVLYSEYSQYEIKENIRPDWLISSRGTRLELDFYIPQAHLAVEVQGLQHYIFVEHFHKTYSKFQQYIQDDQYKKDYCDSHDILLIEVSTEADIDDIRTYLESLKHPKEDEKPINSQKMEIDKGRFLDSCSHLMMLYKHKTDISDDSYIHFDRFINEANSDDTICPEWDFIVFLSSTFPDVGERVSILTKRWLKKNPMKIVAKKNLGYKYFLPSDY